jgi:c-di-GMP-binding flagellar brake protein YcgR
MNSRELVEEEVDAVSNNQHFFQPGLPLRKSVIVDISGGGIRFVSNYKYEKDTMIYMTFRLSVNGTDEEYEVAGKVLTVKELENHEGEYEHRLQYVNIDSAEREEIIRYIFEEERKNRQRRNG